MTLSHELTAERMREKYSRPPRQNHQGKLCPCGAPIRAKGLCKSCYDRDYHAGKKQFLGRPITIVKTDTGFRLKVGPSVLARYGPYKTEYAARKRRAALQGKPFRPYKSTTRDVWTRYTPH